MAEAQEVAVTAAEEEEVVAGQVAVAVEEAEEMAAPVAVVALVSSFLYVLHFKWSKTENNSLIRKQHYVMSSCI